MCFISIFSALTLTDWGSWSAIGAVILAIGLIVWQVARWIVHRYSIKYSMKATYLIPCNQYNNKQYPNAPPKEKYPKKLTISKGKYQLLIRHIPKRVLTERMIPTVELIGDFANKPTRFHLDKHPFVVDKQVDARGEIQDVDWHGNMIPKSNSHQYLPNTVGIIAENIETHGYWRGKIAISFWVDEAEKPLVISLPLNVTDYIENDDASFLKI